MSDKAQGKNSFTTSIESENNTLLIFEFDSIYITGGLKYSVAVFENKERISSFDMELVNFDWRIVQAPMVEERLLLLEPFLNESIKEFLSDSGEADA